MRLSLQGGGMGARMAEVGEDRVLAAAIVPSAAPGGRETGIAWALRGLSLASHAGVIAAAVAVAGPRPPAVIEAYTVEIVFSDSVAGGDGEGTELPQAPSPAPAPGKGVRAESAKAADLADPSTADGAAAGLRAPDPTAPDISLAEAVPVPDPAPPAEVAGPPDGDSPTAMDLSSVLPAAGPPPPVPPAGESRHGTRARFPGPPPRKPRVPKRPREIAEASPAPSEPSADAAGKAPSATPAPATPPPDTPVGTSPPQLETFVASTAPGAAGASPAYRSRGATPLVPPGAAGASPAYRSRGDTPLVPPGAAGASPAYRSRGDTPLVPPGAAGASPAYRSRGDTPLVPPGASAAEEKTAAPVARAPGVSSRETTGSAKRAASAASYTAGHLGNVPPVYPYRARRKEIEGRVVLRVQVLPGGTARSVEVLSSSGHAILDRAALKAVRTWRFVPAKRAGVPVAGAIDVPITFRLAD